jgi:hypothetical protein
VFLSVSLSLFSPTSSSLSSFGVTVSNDACKDEEDKDEEEEEEEEEEADEEEADEEEADEEEVEYEGNAADAYPNTSPDMDTAVYDSGSTLPPPIATALSLSGSTDMRPVKKCCVNFVDQITYCSLLAKPMGF